jgi:hypothetical protein
MLYQLSYASPTTQKTIAGNTGNPRTHSGSAHNTAQFLRLAHRKERSKPADKRDKSTWSQSAGRAKADPVNVDFYMSGLPLFNEST